MPNFEAPQPADNQPRDPTADYHLPSVEHVPIDQAPGTEVPIPVTHETPTGTAAEQDALEAATEARMAIAMGQDAAFFAGHNEAAKNGTRPTIAEGIDLFSDWQGEPTPEPVAESDAGQHVETQDETFEVAAEADVRELDNPAFDALGEEDKRRAAVQVESARVGQPSIVRALKELQETPLSGEKIWEELGVGDESSEPKA